MSKCTPLFVTVPVELTPSSVISTNAVAEDLPVYSDSAEYAIGERIIYNDAIWSAAKDGQLETPTRQSLDWVYVYATNPYRCIDDKIETQTEALGEIVMEIQADDFVSVVGLLNVSATSVRVQMIDSLDGEVYDKTRLMGDPSCADLWEWLFKPFGVRTDMSFNDLPPYRNATIRITITAAPGETAKIGHIVMGMPFYIGLPRSGVNLGIADYSKVQRDEFGNLSLIRRSYSSYADFQLIIETSRIDEVRRTLANLRSRLTYWHGVDELESTFIFGFYRDFEISVQSMQVSECTLHLEGVI